MADIIQGKGPQNPQIKYKDMGDGTHAEVVSVTGLTIEGGVTVDNSGVETRLGAVNETAAAADDSSSGLNGLMKRLLARITVLLDRLPASLSGGRLAVKSDVSLNAGAVDATTQRITVANDGPLMTTLQVTTTTAAGADGTGDYGVIAALKRGLLNWASLLARVPAAITPGLLPVDTLGTVGTARTVAMGSASANVALTTTVRRVSIHATVAGFYSIGTSAQTATTSTHYIGAGERLDLDVAANSQIAAIRATSDGTLYITELV